MPLFTPDPYTEAEKTANRLAEFCAWLLEHPDPPRQVPLIARLKRPAPLGLGRLLGLTRVARGPVPNVVGWVVRWAEAGPGGACVEVGYLVTGSGRTYRLGRKGAVAMFSDRAGFPPQQNPVTAEHAARIEQCLRTSLGARRDRH